MTIVKFNCSQIHVLDQFSHETGDDSNALLGWKSALTVSTEPSSRNRNFSGANDPDHQISGGGGLLSHVSNIRIPMVYQIYRENKRFGVDSIIIELSVSNVGFCAFDLYVYCFPVEKVSEVEFFAWNYWIKYSFSIFTGCRFQPSQTVYLSGRLLFHDAKDRHYHLFLSAWFLSRDIIDNLLKIATCHGTGVPSP